MRLIEKLLGKGLRGECATVDEALALDAEYTTDELCDAADKIRRARCGDRMDTCSIVNARSGRCGEDCKWCAQSARHRTGVEEYPIVDGESLDRAVDHHTRAGVGRLSLVTSGRRVSGRDLDSFCALYSRISARSGMSLCASMGLLDREGMKKLYAAGVRRYHCNLETSSDFFPTLCTTHTHADKLATIAAAREAGMEVCSGGIIGMGESLRQRLTMVAEAREAGAVSVPVNILNPIPGTPLESTAPIGEEEIVRSLALMRFVAPDCVIRFAGGRARISERATRRMLTGGVNGALVGDMLTTVGNDMEGDFEMFRSLGYRF